MPILCLLQVQLVLRQLLGNASVHQIRLQLFAAPVLILYATSPPYFFAAFTSVSLQYSPLWYLSILSLTDLVPISFVGMMQSSCKQALGRAKAPLGHFTFVVKK
jgi:hypothetical protein